MSKGRTTSIIKILIVIVAVFVAAGFSYHPIIERVNLGLDLRGGLHVVMQAKEKTGKKVTADTIDKAIGILYNRVDQLGVKEPVIQKAGTNRVIVELPGVNDPENAATVLPRTAQLEFRDESGNVVVTGANLKEARAQLNPQTNEPVVAIEFDEEGTKKIAAFTAANIGKPLAIVLDDIVQSAPTVKVAIPDGKAVIEGGFETLKEAEELAVLLRSGSLPVSLDTIEKRAIGPPLGSDSLDKSIKACIIGLVMIFVFMIGYYLVPGVVAVISLILYSVIVMWVMVLLDSTLTLPGIAGFILSVGMAVDSNIIIYERIKEEIRNGKTIHAGIRAGFSRAFLTIIDSHVTTFVGAAILMYFGSGPIKGFAVTLTIGIFASLFTALTFTQYLLKNLADVVKQPKYYGV